VIRYHFDLYPRDDPRDGARVVRFTKLQSAEYRGEANGTGSGRFSIRADVAEAQLIDPRGLQYVRVVREDTVAVTEAVVGGFWLETGDFTLLDEQGTRLLSFGGAGTLAYLSRAVMWSHTYISPIFTGQDPFDDVWRLYAQSTFYANGNFLGAMLWRVLYEAQHNTPGTHRHADGVNVSDTHDDDRPSIAIPDMVFDFDQYEDSNGNAWTLSSGEFKAQVGENVLAVVKRLMEAGLYVEMDPDTFELTAFQAATHRRDRTGGSWGASVVRFQAPTGEDIATGNIKSDAKRAIAAFIKRSVVLAGANDVFGMDTGASDIPWEGFYYADVNDADAAEGIAGVQLGARDDAGDTLRLRGRLGTDTANGYYRPFEDALLDDLVTVHTGSDQFDHDEQDFPIAAATVVLRPGGDWDVWYDLGSSYGIGSRQFQVSPVPAHNHPLNLCQPGEGPSSTRLYFSQANSSIAPAASALWDDDSADLGFSGNQLTTTPDSTYGSGSQTVATTGTGGIDVRLGAFSYGPIGAELAADLAAGGGTLRMQAKVGSRYGIGINEAAQDNISQITVRVTQGATSTIRGTAYAGHSLSSSAGSVKWPAQDTEVNRVFPPAAAGNTLSSVSGAAAGDYIVVEFGYRSFSSTTTGARVELNSSSDTDLPSDEVSTGAFNSWINIATSGSGGDLPRDTVRQGEASVGTSTRAARCDHEHEHGLLSEDGDHYHDITQIDGFPDTPEIEGFVLTTQGGQHDVHDHGDLGATETLDLADGNVHVGNLTDDCTFTFTGAVGGVECRFRLHIQQDDTGGWVPTFPGSVVWPDDTEPTWSTDPGSVDIIEFTTVDGGTTYFGDAGGSGTGGGADPSLRWEAVTDGEDVFVWEGDDLVHEWKAY
jgi:hypothetical protein